MRVLTWIVCALAAVVLAFGAVSLYRELAPPVFNGTAYEPALDAPTFTLTDHTGNRASLEDFRGRAVLLFFGYTRCPDVCPLTLTALRRALDSIGAHPDDVRVVLVTVDPQNDTFETLAAYVARFGEGVHGMTGSEDALASLYAAYGVHATPGGPAHAGMMHTDAVFGIDREGKLRVILHPTDGETGLEDDIRTLIRI